MFLGMTNQLVAVNMTSRGRRIGFQDGRHQQPQMDIFVDNFSSNEDTRQVKWLTLCFCIWPISWRHLLLRHNAAILNFKMAPSATSNVYSVNNFSSNEDTNVFQVANPMFLGMANQLAAFNVTSCDRHIVFQYGRRKQPLN